MLSPEGLNFGPESIENEPVFDYIFYDYSDRMSPREIFNVQACNNEEAFEKFTSNFNRKYGTSDYDGFIRQ